jgi:hypothetical protein
MMLIEASLVKLSLWPAMQARRSFKSWTSDQVCHESNYSLKSWVIVYLIDEDSEYKGWQTLPNVDALKMRGLCDLRIISAPLDIPSNENKHIHLELFKHYEFPAGFLTERLRSVGHSFGSGTRADVKCKCSERSGSVLPIGFGPFNHR